MDARTLVQTSRARSGLTKLAFARRVGTSRSALDEIEKGARVPRLDLAVRIAAAGDQELVLADQRSPTARGSTLADHARELDVDDPLWTWRWLTSDFVANVFAPARTDERVGLLAEPPSGSGHRRWDRFVEALAEHLAAHAAVAAPSWVEHGVVDHGSFWWPVHGDRPSTRAAAMAHAPASFARRGILVDGRELPRVVP